MQFMNLSKTCESAAVFLRSLVGTAEPDRGYDPYEREPVKRSEITAMFDLNYRSDNVLGYSQVEQREHDNLTTLRDILYPTGQV